MRFLQLDAPRKSTTRDFTGVFTGSTERLILENNYDLLQQLLMEVHGDCTLMLRRINPAESHVERRGVEVAATSCNSVCLSYAKFKIITAIYCT
jgi:hypothetical protein